MFDKKIISITGNIGAGKTTIITKLVEIFEKLNPTKKIVIINEPVNSWQKEILENGKSLLENFYENPSKYAFLFQINALITRIEIIKNTILENPAADFFIIERSPDDDRFIFADFYLEKGDISKDQIVLFDKWRSVFFEYSKFIKNVILDVKPEICLERIRKRNRKGEDKIELSYLALLDLKYKNFKGSFENLNNYDLNDHSIIYKLIEKYFC